MTSDDDGNVILPPLPPQVEYRAYLSHDDCVPQTVQGIAGDNHVVLLMPRATITARLVGQACDPNATVRATTRQRVDDGRVSRPTTSMPDDCQFEITLQNSGTYDVTFHGPGFIPMHEAFDVAESQHIDLGDIELERGEQFRVKVVHDGTGVPGTQVKIGRGGVPVTTDKTGIAEFSSLPSSQSGATELEFFVEHSAFAPRRVRRRVAPDDTVRIALTDGAEVYGTVQTADATPAVGETIYAGTPNGHVFSATVSGTGTYRFTRLDPGTWMVYRMQTFSTYGTVGTGLQSGDSQTVSLAEGDRREVNFTPAAELHGRVYIQGETVTTPLTIGAVYTGEGESAAVPVRVAETGIYTARLPRPGPWTFRYGDLVYTQAVGGCPCVVDIYLGGETNTGN